MRIIAKPLSYRIKCPSCGAIIEFDKSEAQAKTSVLKDEVYADEDESFEPTYYIDCPECNSAIIVLNGDNFVPSVKAVYADDYKNLFADKGDNK